VLVLWMDSFTNVKHIIVTHEIGHWVLHLWGFCALGYQPKRHSNIEIFLNSMAHHVPLYALQRSFGHEPQTEIDYRAGFNTKLFSKNKKIKKGHALSEDALLLADDMLNCSKGCYTRLENILSRHYPNTLKLAEEIVKLASSYDLLVPEQNLEFSEKVGQHLGLSQGWIKIDDLNKLISMVRKAQQTKNHTQS